MPGCPPACGQADRHGDTADMTPPADPVADDSNATHRLRGPWSRATGVGSSGVRSSLASQVWEVVAGGAQVAGTLVAAPLLRSRYNAWGATPAELASPMPGDDLVPNPRLGCTRAISISAEPADVWAWLVQIGQGRGGLYSFDGLENLARCDIHSTDQIHPELQSLAVGNLIRLGAPEGYPCFRVWGVEPGASLVLVAADPMPPHEVATADSPGGMATWQWQLRRDRHGSGTRLIARQRLTFPDRAKVMWHLVEPVSFVMERQMLRGIKRRAERPLH